MDHEYDYNIDMNMVITSVMQNRILKQIEAWYQSQMFV